MGIKKFGQIDAIRAFCVFFVLTAHWSSSLENISHTLDLGARGVDLFFVISGFLITLGLIATRKKEQTTTTSLYKFYIRRFLRIFPAYYLTLFVLWCFNYQGTRDAIWWYVCYVSNFYSIKIQNWGPLGYTWSLAIEEQFYLIWPFVILLVPRKWLAYTIISAIVLSMGSKIYWHTLQVPLWITFMHPLSALDTLAIGALLAYLYYFHQQRLRQVLYNPYIALAICMQFFIAFYLSKYPNSFINYVGIRPFYGLFGAWIIGRSAFGFTGFAGYLLNLKPLRYMGKISYAIYLFHPAVVDLVANFKEFAQKDLQFLLLFAVTLILASVSWYFYEKPILKLKERFE